MKETDTVGADQRGCFFCFFLELLYAGGASLFSTFLPLVITIIHWNSNMFAMATFICLDLALPIPSSMSSMQALWLPTGPNYIARFPLQPDSKS